MTNSKKTVAVFSHGIANKDEIKKLLKIDQYLVKPNKKEQVDFVVGWGKKENTKVAKEYAHKHQLDYYSLEDGFLHSMGQGVLGSKSCSLVKDAKGIYYDATQSSDLENILIEYSDINFNASILNRAKKTISRITQSNISKYNNGSLHLDDGLFGVKKTVLIIDQTAGDMSLKYGHVDENTFNDMVHAALHDYPNSEIIIKTHPDVIVGKKKGNLNLTNLNSNIKVISDLINPLVLLKKVDVVYVATSQMGYEALMLGKKVICFGAPFYAGWGLTDDRADNKLEVWKRRGQKRTLEDLFAAAYIHYSRYINPITQLPCEIEEVLTYFEKQTKQRFYLSKNIYCINFTRWKQKYIKQYLYDSKKVVYISHTDQAINKGFDENSQLITWASKDQSEAKKIAHKWGGVIWYMEDGFIRSAGLGTDLTAPASLVLDKTGIYYDPNQSSDLETLLQTKQFPKEEIERAAVLKKSLLENELSKYNLGGEFNKSALINHKDNQRIILIPGQVEDDASIKKGCVDVKTNTALIKAVKEKNSEAYLIYKPHPDVVSGNRKGKVDKQITDENCDLVLLDVSITDCLAVVDVVHTMTSLVGFEALMRELKVVCHGIPFYSGWGLTEDFHKVERRTRKLKLNELIHATLIDYPLYMNWETSTLTTPEVIVEQLKQQIELQGGKQSNQVFWLSRFARKVKNYFKGVFLSE